MADCIFCMIINGDIPSAKVYEDHRVLRGSELTDIGMQSCHAVRGGVIIGKIIAGEIAVYIGCGKDYQMIGFFRHGVLTLSRQTVFSRT